MAGLKLIELAPAAVKVGSRFRREKGDIGQLADSIERVGLLHPLVVDESHNLICGGRRLEAVKTLEWKTVQCRVVSVESITLGEFHENEFRKEFTVSERVAIAAAIKAEFAEAGERRGQPKKGSESIPQKIAELPKGKETRQVVAERAGFGNAETLRQAKAVVAKGSPELVKAMDDGAVAISTAAKLAELPKAQQTAVLNAGKGAVQAATKPKPAPEQADITVTWIQAIRGVRERLTGIQESYGSVGQMVRSPLWQRGTERTQAKSITKALAKDLSQFVEEWPDE